ncbi:BREX system ATP-binding domain-containing protein [Pseudanabaena galeata UHCC 0370]|uniref:BREX system ATP-binding domain-containing protein n=1 Tax=Pseudanabaena galeata UHCC 0370 TaxID=3110310 RepID=A0ABU5THT6_9CYAN|nr:BREX system ATP-binding domain-containing protein [Pseudanabaena galeata]MEA5477851.1 BREX system ATP-binding domain-containing protein [Pseudanabaena galeata UHCC 0370]
MTSHEKVVESLRYGIPPEGFVSHFTVGRLSEINELTTRLHNNQAGTLLLKANYGAGKSHLLKFIRETALKQNFVVSSVTLDARSGIRFNRMEQILGEVLKGLEAPNKKEQGISAFLDLICEQARNSNGTEWQRITNNNRWNTSYLLESPAIFIALRAWYSGRSDKNVIQDWLYQRSKYPTKELFHEIVEKANVTYRDEFSWTSNLQWVSYRTKTQIFDFKSNAYLQAWSALRDIDLLARASGLRGLIILFDEFEDVLSNISNINHQEIAFQNLLQFFSGQQFKGMSFFAVTPEFVFKCKHRLSTRDRLDERYVHLDKIPTFEMSPLEINDLKELAQKVRVIHGLAYDWDTNTNSIELGLNSVVERLGNIAVQNRTRQTIKEVVKFLDNQLQEEE